ncbi:MAG: AmmeMemoRadiSam system protein A [Verrucomicrobiae bacterium]|nr:AmmeMemoRadiSam system protein A [Verrucomicrobiae bacterium]
MISLTADEERRLLRWARAAVETGLTEVPESERTPGVCAPHAAFVTLTKRGELRGCIGHLQHDRPLWENVLRAAVSAAYEDPRFPPVEPEEFPDLNYSISVLEPPVELRDLSAFDPPRHGIIVQQGLRRALLLPKVARERGWNAEQVLAAVCQKAGLPSDAWRDPTVRLEIFDAYDIEEPPGSLAGS